VCSINGVVSTSDRPLSDCLRSRHRRICDRLAHRGPDAKGEFHVSACAFFVNEFKITGRATSHQPLVSDDGKVGVVLNGEIYNYHELNRELSRDGAVFHTDSDTETLLRLYEMHGLDCFQRIDGMFAAAIYDAWKGHLVIARDRCGEKPLFYIQRGDTLHFSSESNVLVALTSREFSSRGLAEYLSFGFAWDHVVQGIRRLRPGTFVVASRHGVDTKSYWSPTFNTRYDIAPADAFAEAHEILSQSVRQRIPREVDWGVYISGGLDSSILASFLAGSGARPRLRSSGLVGVNSQGEDFPVGEDFCYVEYFGNELTYAEKLIHGIACHDDSRIFRFGVDELIHDLSAMVAHLPGGPVMSTSFPLFHFTAKNSRHLRVAFNGDGSDELMGGYVTSQPEAYSRTGFAKSFLAATGYFSRDEVMQFLGEPAGELLAEIVRDVDNDIEASFQGDCRPEDVLFNKIRLLMLRHVFCPQLLEKADGMTMAQGPTELRMPYLSHAYIEFALSLPLAVCREGGRKKYILAKLAEKAGVPREIRSRMRKQRTSLPYYTLFYRNSEFRAFVRSLLNRESLLAEVLRVPDAGSFVEQMGGTENADKRAWALLILEVWLREVFAVPSEDGM